jgi:flagellar M-ring protein FliF
MPLRQYVTRLSPRGWLVVGGSVAAMILFFVVVMRIASAPSYSTILTGLNPAQTGKITSTLDTKGIGYEIQNGGTALAVQSSQTSEARIALATAGLLGSSSQPGMDLMNSSQLGASSFQQQVTYQRALEGQLEQTIESIQGVTSAQVQLVLPNTTQQLFSDSATPSTAAVELSGTTSLDPGAVRGIANLVASSVQGLNVQKVTITDGNGNLLWPTAGSGGGGGSMLAKQAAEQTYDQAEAAQLQAMLNQTLGPGKAQVMVNADLNADQSTQQSLTYGKTGVALTSQAQHETLTGNGVSPAGGTTGTIPTYAATGGSGKSNYSNKSSSTTYGVDKTVTNTTIAPGNINRQSISVLVDKSVPSSAIPALQTAVASAAGLNPKRGDTLSVGQVSFAKPSVPTASAPSKMMDYAKYAVIGFAAFAFLIFVVRQLRRREREALGGQPTWLRELETPRSLAALERGQFADEDEEPMQMRQLRPPVNVAKRQVEELVERDPDRVAQQVRAWMAED